MALETEPVSPRASQLPPLPAHAPLPAAHWATLLAIADTVIAAVVPAPGRDGDGDGETAVHLPEPEYRARLDELRRWAADGADERLLADYLAENASAIAAFGAVLQRMLAFNMAQKQRSDLAFVLGLLDTRLGSLVLTGYVTPFAQLPIASRCRVLRGWSTARLGLLRTLYGSLAAVSRQTWAKTSPTLPRLLGFPRTPFNHRSGDAFPFDFVQIPPSTDAGAGAVAVADDDDEPELLDTDVVIVGSGCGAAVCASNLAAAGVRVIVVDKGYYWPAAHLPMTEEDGLNHLFVSGGALVSDDTTTTVLAGQTFGGGGTINWSASLQTQGYVRDEWAAQGLPFFTSAAYQQCLDRVCGRMGVSAAHVRHNRPNAILLEGARRLGWQAAAVPQNTAGAPHYCGHCTYGCGAAEKQGPVVSFLPDAARHGAAFIEGFEVREVLFDGAAASATRRATGVRGRWTSRDVHGGLADRPSRHSRAVTISARRAVIVSAGSLHSPLILRQSGLDNVHIGRNLHLHPVVLAGAVYDEAGAEANAEAEANADADKQGPSEAAAEEAKHNDPVKPWEGGILTAVVTQFENLDGAGHGAKLEACTMVPAIWLPQQICLDPVEFKAACAPRMRHSAGYISLARDRDSGQVYADPHDLRAGRLRPRLRYTPSARDRAHILEGLLALAKIQYVTGAAEICVTVPGVPVFKRRRAEAEAEAEANADADKKHKADSRQDGSEGGPPGKHSSNDDLDLAGGINDPHFQRWLHTLRTIGTNGPDLRFGSAHQMGSCRMSATAQAGVVDPLGRVWGCDGLYVADASVFPSASGVNPMVTTMATADWISRNLAKTLTGQM